MTALRSLFPLTALLALVLQLLQNPHGADAFSVTSVAPRQQQQQRQCQTQLSMTTAATNDSFSKETSRRSFFLKSSSGLASAATAAAIAFTFPSTAAAAAAPERPPLGDLLYRILRVREATMQEMRLIKNGTFKDVQRANIKLAVKFMIENYRLADAFVAASVYLQGTDKRLAAGQVGQNAVQNLYTILEYFDSSDVQNLKVSTALSGKEELVIKGLDASRRSIDDFLAFFPAADVEKAKAVVEQENQLNIKEFDTKALGALLNLPKP